MKTSTSYYPQVDEKLRTDRFSEILSRVKLKLLKSKPFSMAWKFRSRIPKLFQFSKMAIWNLFLTHQKSLQIQLKFSLFSYSWVWYKLHWNVFEQVAFHQHFHESLFIKDRWFICTYRTSDFWMPLLYTGTFRLLHSPFETSCMIQEVNNIRIGFYFFCVWVF